MNSINSEIKWVNNSDIDRQKWDSCIDKCDWGKIYALSWYLDLLTDYQWKALILGDYEYIMPVPFRKKFGIKYTYRPNFCQQLGVFSADNNLNKTVVADFIKKLCSEYRHIHYPLNHANAALLNIGVPYKKRTNLVLSLNNDYESVYSKYSSNLKQNLKKAKNQNLEVIEDLETSKVVELYKNAWQSLNPIPENDYINFQKLIEFAKIKGIANTFGVTSNQKLIAACFLFKYKNRLYYPFSAISPDGKKSGAVAFLIDRLIYKNSNLDLFLDFEGSDIESVKYFYNKFSPTNEPYFLIIQSFYFIESFFFFRNFFKNVLFLKK